MKTILTSLIVLFTFIAFPWGTNISHQWSMVAKVETEVSTNWLAIQTFDAKTKESTQKEIGIIQSNRFGVVMIEGVTNRFLVSSDLHLPSAMLIRNPPRFYFIVSTNYNSGPLYFK